VLNDLRELYRYRDLIYLLVRRDLRIRYKNSALGFFWSLMNPVLQVLIMTIIVKRFFGVPIDNYSAYLFCAILPWEYFSNSVLDSCSSMLQHAPLIRKVRFPREIIPLATVLSVTVHFLLSLCVLGIYFMVLPVHLEWKALWILPIMFFQLLLSLGAGLLLAPINVYFEDVKFIMTALFRILFFAVPVMYPVETVGKLYNVYMLNPIAAFLTAYRKLLLPPVQVDKLQKWTGNPDLVPRGMDWHYVGIAMLMSVVIFGVGCRVFNKMKWGVAERLSY